MSVAKKIAHKAEAVKGGAKKTVGRVPSSRRLQAEGRGGQAKGNIKEAGAKIRTPSNTDHSAPHQPVERHQVKSRSPAPGEGAGVGPELRIDAHLVGAGDVRLGAHVGQVLQLFAHGLVPQLVSSRGLRSAVRVNRGRYPQPLGSGYAVR